jgi:hypothetical protein
VRYHPQYRAALSSDSHICHFLGLYGDHSGPDGQRPCDASSTLEALRFASSLTAACGPFVDESSVIQHVTVGGARTEAFQWDPTAHLSISNSKDCHIHPELKRRVYSAYAEADEGELSIAIPRESVVSLARSRSQSRQSDLVVGTC